MSETALEVLSVAEAIVELQVDADDAPRIARVTSLIPEAVAMVAEGSGIPFVDTSKVIHVGRLLDPTDALELRTTFIKSITQIKFWELTQNLRDDPAGTIAGADLGYAYRDFYAYRVRPPADGWPEMLLDSVMRIELVRGIEGDLDPGVKTAAILVLRHLYRGSSNPQEASAIEYYLNKIKDIAIGSS